MKNYSQEVISNVQKAIDDKQYTITEIKSFDELPKIIKINGAIVKLLINETSGKHESLLELADTYDRKDEDNFRHESFGKFYNKDWKRANKGEETYKNYKIFSASIKDVDIIALIRNTSDYEYQEGDELNYYADILIEDIPYTIIKAYCPTIEESFSRDSLFDEKLFSEKFILSLQTTTDEEDYDEEQSNSEESEELF